MNWAKENKFLAGFIAVLVIGAGILGYLLFSAYGSYSDVSDQYTEKSSALKKLEQRVPYPDAKNLAKYKDERDNLIDATHNLAGNLAQFVLPVREMTPSAFQDLLRETLSAVTQEAAQNNVRLPEHFAMDFDRYQTSPPPATAAGPLGRQLAAVKLIMDILISERVDAIEGFQREPLVEEGIARPGSAPGASRIGRGPEAGVELVKRYPFGVKFLANQPSFQKVLNDLAAATKQFFITRTLLIENTDPKPVPKQLAGPEPAGAAAATPPPSSLPSLVASAAAAPGGAEIGGDRLKFIVGTEKLNVTIQLDMATFNPPAAATRK